jgi:hypothetical protein
LAVKNGAVVKVPSWASTGPLSSAQAGVPMLAGWWAEASLLVKLRQSPPATVTTCRSTPAAVKTTGETDRQPLVLLALLTVRVPRNGSPPSPPTASAATRALDHVDLMGPRVVGATHLGRGSGAASRRGRKEKLARPGTARQGAPVLDR